MFLKMFVIFVKVNAFILNGLGWGSHGPIIKKYLEETKDTQLGINLWFSQIMKQERLDDC
jgi:hypothetical protein